MGKHVKKMSVKASDIRKLYKALLRHSSRFTDYNFREYARRRTRDAFHEHVSETEPQVVSRLYYDGLNNLAVVKRQTAISQMFKGDSVVIEP